MPEAVGVMLAFLLGAALGAVLGAWFGYGWGAVYAVDEVRAALGPTP